MDTYITLEGNITEDDSYSLKQLAQLIEEECDLSVQIKKQEAQPGIKDGGLVIGLMIAGLAFTAIQTLISALQYWESKQNKHSLSITTFDNQVKKRTLSINSSSSQDVQVIVSQLQNESTIDYMKIEITKK